VTPRTRKEMWQAIRVVGLMVAIALAVALVSQCSHAHDEGQWSNQDPAVRDWYQHLMQPDVPTSSCCGEADAYWCDTLHLKGDKTFCTITDDRPDAPLKRPHIDVGTEIEIPMNKLKWDRGNPTGHAILFVSKAGYVFCFVQSSGI
jgi:hypothetical protein